LQCPRLLFVPWLDQDRLLLGADRWLRKHFVETGLTENEGTRGPALLCRLVDVWERFGMEADIGLASTFEIVTKT